MKKLTALSLMALGLSFNAYAQTDQTYLVAYQPQAPVLDGSLTEALWDRLKPIGFSNPWEAGKMPDSQFKAYHDGNYLYFAFDVEDPNIVVFERVHDEMMIARQDRVELFFAQAPIDKVRADGSYPNYFALEMDYHGRTLSIKADSQKNRDVSWDMQTLEAKGSLTDKGYSLEGRIALKELQDLDLIHHNQIQAGVYRAEFSIVNGKEVAHWLTWVDPKTEKPNFHINSSFGTFVLEQQK